MMNTILVRYAIDTPDEAIIKWEQQDDGEWFAWRPGDFFGGDNPDSYRLYDLDAMDLAGVLATTQQVMNGDLPKVYLERRRSDLKFHLGQEA